MKKYIYSLKRENNQNTNGKKLEAIKKRYVPTALLYLLPASCPTAVVPSVTCIVQIRMRKHVLCILQVETYSIRQHGLNHADQKSIYLALKYLNQYVGGDASIPMGESSSARYNVFYFIHFILGIIVTFQLNWLKVYPQRSSGQAVVTGVVPSPSRYAPSFISHVG